MSAILATLGISVAKEAGKFLVKEYGDDALRLWKKHVTERRVSGELSAEVAQATQDGIEQALIELKRPYDEFFGPRIGMGEVPEPEVFPYLTDLTSYPDESKLVTGDIIYVNGSIWTVWHPESGKKAPQPPWSIIKTV